MSTKIWLSPPHMGGDEIRHIEEAIRLNWVAPIGQNINSFELALESYLKSNTSVVCLNSGTSALHLALMLADVKEGDEVLCQSFTFAASAYVVSYLKAMPVFVDSEIDTWNICPEQLEKAIVSRLKIGKKPKAVIVVHAYGMPAKMDEVRMVCDKYNLKIIEDAAAALGSVYKNKKCGSIGDFGIFSFNGNKIITTSAGGALVCHSQQQKETAIFKATQAKENASHYEHKELGFNYRMSNVLAGVGLGQMQVLGEHIEQRRLNHAWYKELFKNTRAIKVHTEPEDNCFSNHWLTCITIDPKLASFNKNDIMRQLDRDNIESRPLWKPMHQQPLYKDCPFYGNGVSSGLFELGLCLPSGSNMKIYDKERIKKRLTPFL